jgi:hypothetical protein
MHYDFVYLGSSPTSEDCVQTTDPDYGIKAYAECHRYCHQLRRQYAAAHGGRECPASLRVKSEHHDFGTYYEVVCKFNTDSQSEIQAAFWLEANQPDKWEDDGNA